MIVSFTIQKIHRRSSVDTCGLKYYRYGNGPIISSSHTAIHTVLRDRGICLRSCPAVWSLRIGQRALGHRLHNVWNRCSAIMEFYLLACAHTARERGATMRRCSFGLIVQWESPCCSLRILLWLVIQQQSNVKVVRLGHLRGRGLLYSHLKNSR